MPVATVKRKKKDIVAPVKLTGDSLISFISGTQTNIGRETFYNMKEEQQKALLSQHEPILSQVRPFYTLMALPEGVNDVNKQLIGFNLIANTIRESDLKDHEHSPTVKWENAIILQTLENVQPNRVFDFFIKLRKDRIANKRAVYLMYEWLKKNENRWDLWTIKYRKDIKSILKHLRHNYKKAFSDAKLSKIWNYLRNNESTGCGQLILDYVAVQKGDKDKLAKLPATVAEGFKKKFNLSDEDFWKLFKQEGGQFTAKEKQLKSNTLQKAGQSTDVDVRKMRLFDLLVYLHSQETLPMSREKIEELFEKKASEIASKLTFKLGKVGLVLDTSVSMFGTKQQPFHPLFRGMAISLVIKQVSKRFKEYRTCESDTLFPTIKNQSNYASAIMRALKDGCDTIIIVGDGYENAPFEGMAHQILYVAKQKINEKLQVFHFNPVYASEAKDVRALSSLAPQVGVREIGALNESMFLAIAKQEPKLAISGYMNYLIGLQSEKVKALMPNSVKELIARNKLLEA